MRNRDSVVNHKEKIKGDEDQCGCSDTDGDAIPRTLHMSLVGIRDMSLLEEPPVDRRPIQTYVMEYDRELARERLPESLQGMVRYTMCTTGSKA